jgi:hypothetical protein
MASWVVNAAAEMSRQKRTSSSTGKGGRPDCTVSASIGQFSWRPGECSTSSPM